MTRLFHKHSGLTQLALVSSGFTGAIEIEHTQTQRMAMGAEARLRRKLKSARLGKEWADFQGIEEDILYRSNAFKENTKQRCAAF